LAIISGKQIYESIPWPSSLMKKQKNKGKSKNMECGSKVKEMWLLYSEDTVVCF
jgi:hypothetical protein